MGGFFVGRAQAHDYSSNELELVRLINVYRAENGLGTLQLSDQLSEAAVRHSLDMARFDFFSHYTKQSTIFYIGAGPWHRMQASGYPSTASTGECIAAGYSDAASILAAWKASPPHNALLLRPEWKAIGVGGAYGGKSTYKQYWTADFGDYLDATAHDPRTQTTATYPPVTTTTLAQPTTTSTVPQTKYATAAEMIDAEILVPRGSVMTGDMVQWMWRWYGIPPHIYLSITGAETSMGTAQGGVLITEGHYNLGCMRFGIHPKADELANPDPVWVAGKDWYSFPNLSWGMMALGRYLKVGPTSDPGLYLRIFKAYPYTWQRPFALVYYGRNIPGLEQYIANLERIDAWLVRTANECGVTW